MTSRQIAYVGFSILVLVPFLYFVLRSGDTTITNYPPKNQKIVAFGDSLIEGVGSTAGNDLSSVVGRSLGVTIINKGKSGDTTEMGLARIDDVLAEDPGIVLVLFGGNDELRRVPHTTVFKNLSAIIERLQKSGAVVVLLGIRGGILADSYESDFLALSQQYHTAYVPNVLQGLLGNARYMYDSIHPNDAGYAMIADRLTPVLQGLVQKNR